MFEEFFIPLSPKTTKLTNWMKMRNLFLMAALWMAACVTAQVPFVGEWITIDDESGEQKSVVNIYKADNGMYYGQITTLFEDPNAVCTEC